MTSALRQVSVVLVCIYPAFSNAGERPDLLPKQVRWQTYPPHVRLVVIDGEGRPWFATDESATLDQVKSQVEISFRLKAPWVPGAQMHHFGGAQILHFDRSGRIWMIPAPTSKVLLRYDPHEKEWIERHVVPESERGGYDERDRMSPALVFSETVHESRSGRLYFADRIGVHVLDGDSWSFFHLYRQNIKDNRFSSEIKSFNEPNFAEDERGFVYVWSSWSTSGWSGTLGYFVHDGRSWRQITTDDDGNKLEWIESVLPLRDGRVLVFPKSGTARIVGEKRPPSRLAGGIENEVRRLGHDNFTEREAAQRRLAEQGSGIVPMLRKLLSDETDLEIASRLRQLIRRFEQNSLPDALVDGHAIHGGRVFGKDGAGRVIFWANHVVEPRGTEPVRNQLWLVDAEGKISRAPRSFGDWQPGNHSTFVDSQGRLWIAKYRKGCVIWDGHKLIPVTNETQTAFSKILGEDNDGRVYISSGIQVVAVDMKRPECSDFGPNSE